MCLNPEKQMKQKMIEINNIDEFSADVHGYNKFYHVLFKAYDDQMVSFGKTFDALLTLAEFRHIVKYQEPDILDRVNFQTYSYYGKGDKFNTFMPIFKVMKESRPDSRCVYLEIKEVSEWTI